MLLFFIVRNQKLIICFFRCFLLVVPYHALCGTNLQYYYSIVLQYYAYILYIFQISILIHSTTKSPLE